jgi:hypothetical protein
MASSSCIELCMPARRTRSLAVCSSWTGGRVCLATGAAFMLVSACAPTSPLLRDASVTGA